MQLFMDFSYYVLFHQTNVTIFIYSPTNGHEFSPSVSCACLSLGYKPMNGITGSLYKVTGLKRHEQTWLGS